MSTTERAVGSERQRNTLVNALVGGVAAVVLAALPFSTVLGGALAGYLQGPDTREGLRVGALAGVVAAVPLVLVAFLFGGMVFAFVPFGMGVGAGMGMDPWVGGMAGAFGFVAIMLFALFGLVYTVGLAALGGILGAYLNREFEGE